MLSTQVYPASVKSLGVSIGSGLPFLKFFFGISPDGHFKIVGHGKKISYKNRWGSTVFEVFLRDLSWWSL